MPKKRKQRTLVTDFQKAAIAREYSAAPKHEKAKIAKKHNLRTTSISRWVADGWHLRGSVESQEKQNGSIQEAVIDKLFDLYDAEVLTRKQLVEAIREL